MSDDKFNQRAANGQAFNLACNEAISLGKMGDMKFLAERFIFYKQTAALFQKADLATLANIAEHPEVLELFNKINKELS